MDDELAATGREESDPGYLRNGELRKIFGKSEPTLERAQAEGHRVGAGAVGPGL